MTDNKFMAVIRKASGADTYYFTENQLDAEWRRRQKRHPLVSAVFLAMGFGVMMFILWKVLNDVNARGGYYFWLLVAFGVTAMALWRLAAALLPSKVRFGRYTDKWLGAGRKLDKLITQPHLHHPPPEWSEPDIYDYGVERVIFVDRDILVDLFVRNGLHARERALIMSVGGYPAYLVPRAKQVLAERGDLPVFFMHDAHPDASRLLDKIAAEYNIPHDRITDLGLSAEDVKRMKTLRSAPTTDGVVPLDAMPMPRMTEVVAMSLLHGAAISMLLDQADSRGGGEVDFG